MLAILQEWPEGFDWLIGSQGLSKHSNEDMVGILVDIVAEIIG